MDPANAWPRNGWLNSGGGGRLVKMRAELACHIHRLERSLEGHELGPVDALIVEKIAEVKTTSVECRQEEVRMSNALRLGLDPCRSMAGLKAWMKSVEQYTSTDDAEEKLAELESALWKVALGLRAVVKESSDKVDAMLEKLRKAASVVGLQSLTTTRCAICYDNQLECYINPCGHTMCNSCAGMLNGVCFVCKEQYQSVRPLFLS